MAERAHPRFTPQLRDIESVTATDARTVVFALRHAALGFEDQPLADVPILPRHLWEGLPAGQAAPRGLPVGTGPFRLVRHVAGKRYSFRANRGVLQGRAADRRAAGADRRPRGERLRAAQARGAGRDAGQPARGRDDRALRAPSSSPRASRSAGRCSSSTSRGRRFDRRAARQAVARALRLGAIAGNENGPGAMAPAERGMLHPQSRWAPAATLHRADVEAARLAFAERAVEPFEILASRSDGVRLEAARRVVAALRHGGRTGPPAGADGAPARTAPRPRRRRRGLRRRRRRDPSAGVLRPRLPAQRLRRSRERHAERRRLPQRRFRAGRRPGRVGDERTPPARRPSRTSSSCSRRTCRRSRCSSAARRSPIARAATPDGSTSWAAGSSTSSRSCRPRRTPAAAPHGRRGGDPRDTADEGGSFSLVPIIIGLVVLLILGGAWAARRGRNANFPARPAR